VPFSNVVSECRHFPTTTHLTDHQQHGLLSEPAAIDNQRVTYGIPKDGSLVSKHVAVNVINGVLQRAYVG
jgi:hypothetical protein